MSKTAFLAAALALSFPAAASAATYEINPAHSGASFAVKHMMVSTVRGEFGKLTGFATIDDADPKKSQIEATIDASTINTRVDKRDAHLRGPDFFDVGKYPAITFKSTNVKRAAAGKYKVTGDLTMHGVTRSVVLDVDSPAKELKDPMGQVARGATATTKLNRKDFGLNWNKALEAGGVLVGDQVDVTIDLELNRKDASAATATAAPAK
jgi:polyisoprenoid-binding protein YceI